MPKDFTAIDGLVEVVVIPGIRDEDTELRLEYHTSQYIQDGEVFKDFKITIYEHDSQCTLGMMLTVEQMHAVVAAMQDYLPNTDHFRDETDMDILRRVFEDRRTAGDVSLAMHAIAQDRVGSSHAILTGLGMLLAERQCVDFYVAGTALYLTAADSNYSNDPAPFMRIDGNRDQPMTHSCTLAYRGARFLMEVFDAPTGADMGNAGPLAANWAQPQGSVLFI